MTKIEIIKRYATLFEMIKRFNMLYQYVFSVKQFSNRKDHLKLRNSQGYESSGEDRYHAQW